MPIGKGQLRSELSDYDGKQHQILEDLALRIDFDSATIRALVDLCSVEEGSIAAGASWLLKRFSDAGEVFTSRQTERLLEVLTRSADWAVQLHLLQMLPGWLLPDALASTLARRLRGLGEGENKFVRAWAFNAMAELGEQHARYRPEAKQMLAAAAESQPPAVRARIRNAVKAHDWLRD